MFYCNFELEIGPIRLICSAEVKLLTHQVTLWSVFSRTTTGGDYWLLTGYVLCFFSANQKSKKGAWTSPVEGVSCKFFVRNTALRTSHIVVDLVWGCMSRQLHRVHLWKVGKPSFWSCWASVGFGVGTVSWPFLCWKNCPELTRKRNITMYYNAFLSEELRDCNLTKTESWSRGSTSCCKSKFPYSITESEFVNER